MSRTPLAFAVGDISVFARALRRGLDGLDRLPGHVEMLNLLVRAAGYRNFQHYAAVNGTAVAPVVPEPAVAAPGLPPAETPESVVDPKRLNRLVRYFDDQGRLVRWPNKHTQRVSCLWVLWSRLPKGRAMTEAEISAWLGERHLFGDHALLRRELVDQGMVTRTPDGREYRRLEQRPPDEALALMERLRSRTTH